MTVQVVTRGNVATITATFMDADGDPADPASAAATLSYPISDGTRATATVTLTGTLGVWSGTWDTTAIYPGMIYGSVKSQGPHTAEDFEFLIEGNVANLET